MGGKHVLTEGAGCDQIVCTSFYRLPDTFGANLPRFLRKERPEARTITTTHCVVPVALHLDQTICGQPRYHLSWRLVDTAVSAEVARIVICETSMKYPFW